MTETCSRHSDAKEALLGLETIDLLVELVLVGIEPVGSGRGVEEAERCACAYDDGSSITG